MISSETIVLSDTMIVVSFEDVTATLCFLWLIHVLRVESTAVVQTVKLAGMVDQDCQRPAITHWRCNFHADTAPGGSWAR